MAVQERYNRPCFFGAPTSRCVFAIVDFKNFLASTALEYATVTGTLAEVATPYGTGLEVSVANSYVHFDWTSLAPLTIAPRSVFIRAYFSAENASNYLVSYGAAVNQDCFLAAFGAAGGPGLEVLLGGFMGDVDQMLGPGLNTWFDLAVTNEGVIGGANVVYWDGAPLVSGVNLLAGNTTYADMYLFRRSDAVGQCPVGTIIQEVLVFARVLTPADVLFLHNSPIGVG